MDVVLLEVKTVVSSYGAIQECPKCDRTIEGSLCDEGHTAIVDHLMKAHGLEYLTQTCGRDGRHGERFPMFKLKNHWARHRLLRSRFNLRRF